MPINVINVCVCVYVYVYVCVCVCVYVYIYIKYHGDMVMGKIDKKIPDAIELLFLCCWFGFVWFWGVFFGLLMWLLKICLLWIQTKLSRHLSIII